MSNKKIIGITGLTGSGKDTVADFLVNGGFEYSSLSDRIREECARKGLETNRDNLINIGNELREKYGFNELARRSIDAVKNSSGDKYVIVSFRHPDEANYLKENGMVLIAVTAPIELRYERNMRRGRAEDHVSFEEFKEQEERERSGSENQQQVDKVIAMADYTINNSGTLKDLEKQVDEILKKI